MSLTEMLWWLFIVVGVASAPQVLSDGNIAAPLLAAIGIGARVAIATERVTCDKLGISWRTLLVHRFVPWSQVTGIEIDPAWQPLRLPSPYNFRHRCLVVRTPTAVRAIRASIWCPLMSQLQFIADARLLSPTDWYDDDRAT